MRFTLEDIEILSAYGYEVVLDNGNITCIYKEVPFDEEKNS
jgi:hypothetical protein